MSDVGYWSKTRTELADELVCETTFCEDIAGSLKGYVTSLTQPENSDVTYPALGSRITLQCPAGTYGGQAYLECADDGSWRGVPPNCTSRYSCGQLTLGSTSKQPLAPDNIENGETLTPQFVQIDMFTDAVDVDGGILHSDADIEAAAGTFDMGTVARYSCTSDAPMPYALSVKPLYRVCDGQTGRWTWANEARDYACVAPVCPLLTTIMSVHHEVLPYAPVPGVQYTEADTLPASQISAGPGSTVAVRCRNPSRPADLAWLSLQCDELTRQWKYNATQLAQCLDLQCARSVLPAGVVVVRTSGTFSRPWTGAGGQFPDVAPVGASVVLSCDTDMHASPRSPRSLWMTCVSPGLGGAGAMWTNASLLALAPHSWDAPTPTGLGDIELDPPEFKCQTAPANMACLHVGNTMSNLIRSAPMKVGAYSYPIVGASTLLTCAPLPEDGSVALELPSAAPDSTSNSDDLNDGNVDEGIANESERPVLRQTGISRKIERLRRATSGMSSLTTNSSFNVAFALLVSDVDSSDDPLSFRPGVIYCSPVGAWVGLFLACGTAPPSLYTGCGVPPRPAVTNSAILIHADALLLSNQVMAATNPSKNYPLGTRIRYTCESGFVPAGNANLLATCELRPSVTHTDAPVWVGADNVLNFNCVRAECPLPPSVNSSVYTTTEIYHTLIGGWENPMLTATTGYPLGTVLRGICRYDAVRAPGRDDHEVSWKCIQKGATAEWESDHASSFLLGLCVPVVNGTFAACELPGTVSNTIVTVSEHDGNQNIASYPLVESMITYECAPHTHYVGGSLVRRCSSSGSWDEEPPQCTTTPMCLSAALMFGVNTTATSLAIDGVGLAYSTEPAIGGSFPIATTVRVTCVSEIGATPAAPATDAKRTYECVEDEAPWNATLQTGVWRLRDPATGDLVLSGPLADSVLQCVVPQCEDVLPELKARFIVAQQSARLDVPREYPSASVSLHLSCAQGYDLDPSIALGSDTCPDAPEGTLSTLKCLTDGQWHGVVPLCVPVQCPHVTEVLYELDDNGDVLSSRVVVPPGGLGDQPSAAWNATAPHDECDLGEPCRLHGAIASIVTAAVSSYKHASGYPGFRSEVTVSCPVGYVADSSTLECAADGLWYGRRPACERVFCQPPPQAPQTMTVTVRDAGTDGAVYQVRPAPGYPVGARATYACRSETAVVDSLAVAQQVLECGSAGTWEAVLVSQVSLELLGAVPRAGLCLFTTACPPLPLVVSFVGTQMVATSSYDAQRTSHPFGTLATLGCRTWFTPVAGTASALNCTAMGWTAYYSGVTPMSAGEDAAASEQSEDLMVVQATKTVTVVESALPLQCSPTAQCVEFPAIDGGSVSYSDSRIPGSFVVPKCTSSAFKPSVTTPITCNRVASDVVNALDTLAPIVFDTAEQLSSLSNSNPTSQARVTAARPRAVSAAAVSTAGTSWSVDFVECLPRYDCGPLPIVSPVAYVYYSSPSCETRHTLEGSRAHVTCESSRYVAVQDIVCRADGWSTLTPCVPVHCTDPLAGETSTATKPLPLASFRRGGFVRD